MSHLEASLVDGGRGVGHAEEGADGAPDLARVVDAGPVADVDAGPVEELHEEAADAAVRRHHGHVALLDVGRVVRTALAHQIRAPVVEHAATCATEKRTNQRSSFSKTINTKSHIN